MADLHAGSPHAGRAAIARWVRRMNAERPDVVALLGDYLDAHFLWGGRMEPGVVAEELSALSAPRGVVAVLGNHDWKQAGVRMGGALRGAGITVLENEAVHVGDGLHVAGLADLRMRRPDVTAALAAVPRDAPVVLLTHDPDVFPHVPARVGLTLAGHTHGGQVAIPHLRRPFVPSRYGERYVRGHVEEDGRQMIVTAGLGTSGAPLRLFAPPELLVLEPRA